MYRVEALGDLGGQRRSWDELVAAAGGSAFHTSAWLAAFAEGAPGRYEAFYLLAKDAAGVVKAVCPLFLHHCCPRLTAHRTVVLRQPTALAEPMLLGHSFYAFYGGPVAIDSAAAAACIAAGEQLAADHGASVYGLVNVPAQGPLPALLADRGFQVNYLSSTMVLPLHGRNLEAWLAELPRKKRWFARSVLRQAAEAGLTAGVEPLPQDPDELVTLAESVLQQHGHGFSHLFDRRFLQASGRHLADQGAHLAVRSADGRLLTSLVLLRAGRTLTAWIGGVDYQSLARWPHYHLAYLRLIEYACRAGFAELDLGRGSYRFKARYLCRRRPLLFAARATAKGDQAEVARWLDDLAHSALARYRAQMAGHKGPDREVEVDCSKP